MSGTNWYVKIDGGIGRCIAATGAIEEFAKRKSEEGDSVGIVTSFPQIFEGLDYIDRVYNINMQYVYEDYISKGEFLEPEPYNSSKYYKDEKHLAQVFNFLLNGKDEFIRPKMVLTENEVVSARAFIESERKSHGKKIVLIQPWGSSGGKLVQIPTQNNSTQVNQGNPVQPNQVTSPQNAFGVPQQEFKVMIDESYRSFGTEFGERLNKRLLDEGYQTYIVKTPDQVGFTGAKTFNNLSPRQIICLIPFADGAIACDSFLHHASAALGSPVPTIVLWAGTNEKNLGYSDQTNIHSWKKTLFEPNRIPHNHEYYVNKNKGSNEFKLEMIDEIVSALKKKKE